eukprot:UN17858
MRRWKLKSSTFEKNEKILLQNLNNQTTQINFAPPEHLLNSRFV